MDLRDFNLFKQSTQLLNGLVRETHNGGSGARWYKQDKHFEFDSLVTWDLKNEHGHDDSCNYDNFIRENQYVLVPKSIPNDDNTVYYLPVLSLQPFQKKLDLACSRFYPLRDPVGYRLECDRAEGRQSRVTKDDPLQASWSYSSERPRESVASRSIEMPPPRNESNMSRVNNDHAHEEKKLSCAFCAWINPNAPAPAHTAGARDGTINCPHYREFHSATRNPAPIVEPIPEIVPKKKSTLVCKFCKKNKQPSYIYNSHTLHDSNGNIVCFYLRTYVCDICNRQGHTRKYCPDNKFEWVLTATEDPFA